MNKSKYLIGDVANLMGISRDTLRHYVKTGFWKRDPDFPDALSMLGYCGQGYLRSETSILASDQRDEGPTGACGNL